MSRLIVPAKCFSHRFRVGDDDIDALGHAGNVVWVRWVNDAATQHSESVGLGIDEYKKMGLLWVVRRHDITYLGSAYAGEELVAHTWIASVRGATSLRQTVIQRAVDDALLCEASTTWVMIRIDSGRPTRVPRELWDRYDFEGP